MYHRIVALIYKELLAVWRDKKSRIVLILPPLTQLLIFAFAATLDVKNVPIGILNRDNGEQAFELVQRFHGAPTFNHIVYLKCSRGNCPFYRYADKALWWFQSMSNFHEILNARNAADVQLILDGRKSNTAQIVAGYTADHY